MHEDAQTDRCGLCVVNCLAFKPGKKTRQFTGPSTVLQSQTVVGKQWDKITDASRFNELSEQHAGASDIKDEVTFIWEKPRETSFQNVL